jgi:hypothetical protein
MKIIPFDLRDPKQRRFVFSYFCRGSDRPAKELDRLIDDGARIVLGVGQDVDPHAVQFDDPIYGFAAATADGRVIWVYVQTPVEHASGMISFRKQGRSKALLAALGFQRDAPVPVLYDTRAARRWAERGWQIVFPEPSPKENHG